ncbi:ROK family protein [Clostridium sp. CF012]|uniref:ROK family protein n=1 Tax=Clostridium sp. CF012 TaxID=2843319 RepID=UPI001C0AA8C5|nr:ROK family protein [Clostridium sp. CF012]MBU3144384.1 ROK family protein [Clostridium sp. CF012]
MKQIVSNTAQVKRYNVEIVKNALKALTGGTKTTIARITGLSVATCNTILNELAATGEILEGTNEYSSIGRPAQFYRFNENYSYICCIYMTYENRSKILTYAVVNLVGDVIKEKSMVSARIDYDVIENTVEQLIAKYENIKAVGIGIPGVVNQQNVIDICDIEELGNCALAERLTNKLGMDVVIENDMNSIAYGVYQAGEYQEDTSIAVVAFYKDNWPGSGIIVDGHIIRGNTNFAGEVSYLPLGCTHEKQKELLKNREDTIQLVAKTICSLTAIINPHTIVMTGTALSDDMMDEICLLVSEIIPKNHIPKIILEHNIQEYYLKGLSSMTLEYVNNPIRKINP